MAPFELSWQPVQLPLKHTFTISRGAKYRAQNVFIRLESGGIIGYGEAAPNIRYNETPESVISFLKKVNVAGTGNIYDISKIMEHIVAIDPHQASAHAAVEMALCDWIGRKLQLPLHRLWNAPSTTGPQSSVTLGLGNPDELEQRLEETSDYPVLKVKLGGEHDREIIRMIRRHTDKTLWVDANEGWKDPAVALEMIEFLSDEGVALIEQPMPADRIEDISRLRNQTSVPIFADEGFTGKESLAVIAEAYDGVNIKLMKIGGMIPALRTISRARQLGLKVMVGCMLESSLANTAAAIVSLFADHADLDGPFLLAEDPFEGFRLSDDAHIQLNEQPGLGVTLTHTAHINFDRE